MLDSHRSCPDGLKSTMKNLIFDRSDDVSTADLKKLYIATFGCQMNDYDSQRMAQILRNRYVLTSRPEEADLVLVNTCAIREKAENKAYSLLGRFRKLKKLRPEMVIGITGCVAQLEGGRLLHRMPFLDLVIGPLEIYRLPEILEDGRAAEKWPSVHTELDRDFSIPLVRAPLPENNPVRTFVTIMQGCDNFCTYCVVPNVRGREISRPPGDIVAEVEHVLAQGVREVILLGQNVNSYGKKNRDYPCFSGLLRAVAGVPGLERLRFTTSHPRDLTSDIMKCFREVPQLCEHLHLPVQSGSTGILKRMNRHYTRDQYLSTVDRLKSICPEIVLTTDLIVGFPGETDSDFLDTLSLLETVEFEQIFPFKYSPRPGTRAASFEDQVPLHVQNERFEEVLRVQNEIGMRRHKVLEGRKQEVLIEGPSRGDRSEITGRTRGNHVINLPGPAELAGEVVTVEIERACCHSLRGRLPGSVSLQDEGFTSVTNELY